MILRFKGLGFRLRVLLGSCRVFGLSALNLKIGPFCEGYGCIRIPTTLNARGIL